MPIRLDKLTLNFIIAVVLTDCQVVFFAWYEVFYRDQDSLLATLIGVGIGVTIALAVTITTFAHWEVVRMISERYLKQRFNAGKEEGREEGKEEGREEGRTETLEEERKRIKEALEEIGGKLTPEEQERLLGTSDGKRS